MTLFLNTLVECYILTTLIIYFNIFGAELKSNTTKQRTHRKVREGCKSVTADRITGFEHVIEPEKKKKVLHNSTSICASRT